MSFIKNHIILISVLFILLILLVLSYFIVPRYTDMSEYKIEIESNLTNAFHANTLIEGEMYVKLFPNPVLKITDISVKNDYYSASIPELDLPVKFSSLLKKEKISIPEKISLDNVNIQIEETSENIVKFLFNNYSLIPFDISFNNASVKDKQNTYSKMSGTLYKSDSDILKTSGILNGEIYEFYLSKYNNLNRIELNNKNQALNARFDFKYINGKPLGSGQFTITSPNLLTFLTTQLNVKDFNFEIFKKVWKIYGEFSNKDDQIKFSNLTFISPDISGENSEITIPNDKTKNTMLKLNLTNWNMDSMMNFDSDSKIFQTLNTMKKYHFDIKGVGKFMYKNTRFNEIVYNAVSEKENTNINKLELKGTGFYLNLSGDVSLKNNKFNILSSNLIFNTPNINELFDFKVFDKIANIPNYMSIICNFSGNLDSWTCDNMKISDKTNLITGKIKYIKSPKNIEMEIKSNKLDLDKIVLYKASDPVNTLIYLNDKFSFNWKIDTDIKKLLINNKNFSEIKTTIQHKPNNYIISKTNPLIYDSDDSKIKLFGDLLLNNKNWEYKDFNIERTNTSLSDIEFINEENNILPRKFLNVKSGLNMILNKSIEKPEIKANFLSKDFSIQFDKKNKDISFKFYYNNARDFLLLIIPDLYFDMLKPDTTLSISGNLINGTKVNNAKIEIGKEKINGVFDFSKNSKDISLSSDTLNLDSFINPDYDSEVASFRAPPALITLLNISDLSFSLKTNNIIFADKKYGRINFSVNTKLDKPVENISLTSSNNETLIGEIIKDKDSYSIKAKTNKFYIPEFTISKKANLSIEKANLTMTADLSTTGITAYDIYHNISGILDLEFTDGYINGLGFDNFYASNITFNNVEEKVSEMLTRGLSKFDLLNVRGIIKDGKFSNTDKISYISKFVSIQGDVNKSDTDFSLESEIVMSGTSVNPKPFDFDILSNGLRQFSTFQIQKNIDPTFMNYYLIKPQTKRL